MILLFYIVFHHLRCHCCLLLSFQFRAGAFPPTGVVGGRYLYTSDLLKLGAFCQADVKPQLGKGSHPYHLASLLCHHPDRCFVSWLLRGLDEGFPIGFDPARCNLRSVACNHPSSLCNKEVVALYIDTKCHWVAWSAQWRQRGFTLVPLVSARQPGRWQMIVDLSCPPCSSVNDGIDPSLSSICYASVDNAVEIIRSLGQGTLLTKLT